MAHGIAFNRAEVQDISAAIRSSESAEPARSRMFVYCRIGPSPTCVGSGESVQGGFSNLSPDGSLQNFEV